MVSENYAGYHSIYKRMHFLMRELQSKSAVNGNVAAFDYLFILFIYTEKPGVQKASRGVIHKE